jgi:hypothetical protein
MIYLIAFFALYGIFFDRGDKIQGVPAWQTAAIPAVFFTGMIAIIASLFRLIMAISRRPRLRSALIGVLVIMAVVKGVNHRDVIWDGLQKSVIKAYDEFPVTAHQFEEDLPSTSLQLQELPSTSLELPTVRFVYPYSPVVDDRDGYVVPHPVLDYTVDHDTWEKEVNLEAEKVTLWVFPPWDPEDLWLHRLDAWRKSFIVQADELERSVSPETEGFAEFQSLWNYLQEEIGKERKDGFRLFQGVWRTERALHMVWWKVKKEP